MGPNWKTEYIIYILSQGKVYVYEKTKACLKAKIINSSNPTCILTCCTLFWLIDYIWSLNIIEYMMIKKETDY